MSALLVIARVLFSLLFLSSGINHFTKLEAMTGYAKYKKLPAAQAGVLLSGLFMVVGSLSIITGYLADLGALLIAAFLVVATFIFHGFWAETDATAKMNETISFFKGISLAGASLIIFGFAHAATKLNESMHIQIFGWVISKGHIGLWK